MTTVPSAAAVSVKGALQDVPPGRLLLIVSVYVPAATSTVCPAPAYAAVPRQLRAALMVRFGVLGFCTCVQVLLSLPVTAT